MFIILLFKFEHFFKKLIPRSVGFPSGMHNWPLPLQGASSCGLHFISYNVSKKTAIHIFIELQFLLLHKFKNVINIDHNHQNHKCDKQLIHCLLIDFFIDRTSTDSSGDTTCNHKDQYSDLKIRYASWNDRWNQACNLREENNVQRVFRRNFCWHRKEEK